MRNENMIEPQNPQCVQTSVSGSVLSTETRYYLFENNSTNDTEINFISQILLFSEKVQKFNCGIGEFILGITSRFDDSCESEVRIINEKIY